MRLHPILVHLPIALAVLMPLVTGGVLLAWWRGALPRRTWIIALVLQAMLVGTGIAALRTGEVDEEVVERVVPEGPLHVHEEAAEVFTYASGAVLALMLVAGVVRRESVARGFAAASFVGTLAVLLLGYGAGKAGGELVYRYNAGAAYSTPGEGVPPAAEHHD